MTDTITPAMIDRAEKAGACEDALQWLREAPRTFDQMVDCAPGWYLWAVWKAECEGLWVTQERIDRCVRKAPRAALAYAAKYLTPETLHDCARKCPQTALLYARPYMPADLIAWCRRALDQAARP